MSYFRRAKFAVDAARNSLRSIVQPKSPLPGSSIKVLRNSESSISAPFTARVSGFSPYTSISRSNLANKLNQYQCNPFLNGAKRYYYVDRSQVRHFRPRGPNKWFQNPRNVMIVVLVSSGAVITLYFGKLETIPYTKRSHFVLLSRAMERRLGEHQFEQMKGSFKGKILPAIHPDSVRVRLISKEIIGALQRGLKQHEQVWSDMGYASPESAIGGESGHDTLMAGGEGKVEAKWSRNDEILDDKWVQQSRKKGQEKGANSSHLEGLNWEVLVVDEPVVNAFCLPGGKIVVFTGLLKHFKSNDEIATIIGHEVGHAVARHAAEGITKNLWFAILQIILLQFVTPDLANAMSSLLLRLPFSRKMEMEADYIGLLLIASAGFNPRVAPSVYEKLGKISGGDKSVMADYLSTHPSGKKRAQLLTQAKVMEEALNIYRETRSGRGVEGFL